MKKSHQVATSLAMLTAVGAAAPAAHGAMYFEEDFSGNALPSNMEYTQTDRDPLTDAPTFEDGLVKFGPDQGTFVRTIASDYNTVDFVAELSVNITNTGRGMWLGIGAGEGGGPTAEGNYGSPHVAPVVTLEGAWGAANGRIWTVDSSEGTIADSLFPEDDEEGQGTHLYRMAYDAAAQTVVFSVDVDSNGTFDAVSGAIDVSGLGLDSSNAHIFFGSSDENTVNSLNVVPEPGSLALLGMGGLMLLRRRRS